MGSTNKRCILKGVRIQKSRRTWYLETVFICVKIAVNQGKYSKRIEKFFDFLGLEGKTVEEKA